MLDGVRYGTVDLGLVVKAGWMRRWIVSQRLLITSTKSHYH